MAVITHQLAAAVTVNADQAALAVDIGPQLVILKAIRTGLGLLIREGGAVFAVEIVLEAAVIVKADPIAVMAGQTATVVGLGEENVAGQLAVGHGEVTGGATGAVLGGGIGIAGGVEMAAQAAATEHVVGQGRQGGWWFLDRNLGEIAELFACAKGAAHQIDEIGLAEMEAVLAG